MKITVTQEHINRGVPCRHYSCPIALALKEATGEEWRVGPFFPFTDSEDMDWRAEVDDEGRIVLPKNAAKFAEDFDGRRPVKPFTFEIPYEKETA